MKEIPAPKGREGRYTLTARTEPHIESWLAGLKLSASEINDLRLFYKKITAEQRAYKRRSFGLFSTSYQLSKQEADRRLTLALREELGVQHV